MPNESLPCKTIPNFNRVRVVTLVRDKLLRCSCGFFSRHDLPCSHVLCITDELNSKMCGLEWWKAYDRHFLKDESITKDMIEVIKSHPVLYNLYTSSSWSSNYSLRNCATNSIV
ncbi:MAG: SWIM zinc finger family protein [bacterium]